MSYESISLVEMDDFLRQRRFKPVDLYFRRRPVKEWVYERRLPQNANHFVRVYTTIQRYGGKTDQSRDVGKDAIRVQVIYRDEKGETLVSMPKRVNRISTWRDNLDDRLKEVAESLPKVKMDSRGEPMTLRKKRGNLFWGSRDYPAFKETRRYGSEQAESEDGRKGVAVLIPDESTYGPQISGTVYFEETNEGVKIDYQIRGLYDGPHGFHIHEYGDLTDGCTSACAHFNPDGATHGGLDTKIRHFGDLGNIESKDRLAEGSLFLPNGRLDGSKYSILGRMIIVHADRDDLGEGGDEESLKTGNAGKRLACGVIGLADPKDAVDKKAETVRECCECGKTEGITTIQAGTFCWNCLPINLGAESSEENFACTDYIIKEIKRIWYSPAQKDITYWVEHNMAGDGLLAYSDGFDLPDGSEGVDITKDEYFERMFESFLERFEKGSWMYSDDNHGIMIQGDRVLYVPVGTPVNLDSLGNWENRKGDRYGVYGDKITSWLWTPEIYAGVIFGHDDINHMIGEEGKDFDRIHLTVWVPWEAVDWASTIAFNISSHWQENELCIMDKEPVYELNFSRNEVDEASLDKAMNAEDNYDATYGKKQAKIRRRLKNKIMKQNIMGTKANKWSARKSQELKRQYEKACEKAGLASYKGSKTAKQDDLSNWSKQKWTTASGKKSSVTGEPYFPEKAVAALKNRGLYAKAKRQKRSANKANRNARYSDDIREVVGQFRAEEYLNPNDPEMINILLLEWAMKTNETYDSLTIQKGLANYIDVSPYDFVRHMQNQDLISLKPAVNLGWNALVPADFLYYLQDKDRDHWINMKSRAVGIERYKYLKEKISEERYWLSDSKKDYHRWSFQSAINYQNI